MVDFDLQQSDSQYDEADRVPEGSEEEDYKESQALDTIPLCPRLVHVQIYSELSDFSSTALIFVRNILELNKKVSYRKRYCPV